MTVKPGSKYFALYEYLRQSGKEKVVLGLDDIERIILDSLPASARKDRAFWSNRGRGAVQAAAWIQSGYHVVGIDLESEQIVFERPVLRYMVRREGDTIMWNAAMIRALREHLGVNQAGMAALLGVRQQTVSEWESAVYSPTRARSKHLSMVAEKVEFSFEEGFHESYTSRKTKLDNSSETV
jgi:DNA-binding XRE family transcriptional regulator